VGRFKHRLYATLIFIFITCFICCTLPDHSAQAQSAISYGETVSGAITAEAFRVLYTFEGKSGDVVNIAMAATDGTLDPVLLLIGADNRLLGRADDSGDDAGDNSGDVALLTAARIQNVLLPADGMYFIIATRYGQEQGITDGTYSLVLERVGLINEAGRNIVLRFGENIVETIDDVTPQREFAFSALRGEIITIKMKRITGDLDPSLVLTDANGAVLLTNDEDSNIPGTSDAGINQFRVRDSGNFVIITTRYGGSAGTSQGAFSLSLDRLDGAEVGLTPDLPLLLGYNEPVQGTITKDAPTRYYQLDVQSGTALVIEVRRTKGTLDPTVTLLGADGLRVLEKQDSGARGIFARITNYSVLADDTVLVAVSRFNGANGITSGDYTLVAGIR